VPFVSLVAFGEFLTGLVLGLVIGFVAGPLVRFWLAWHEWRDSSREARLTEATMNRMDEGPWRLLAGRGAAASRRPHPRPDAP
jgi:hypothetical protein